MWIDTESLMKLEEKYTTDQAFVDAFKNGYIDDDTLFQLYKSFKWRKVCDNDMFEAYLNSIFARFGQQYEDLLRIQLTRIDPMVTKYLERELKHGGTTGVKRSGSTTYGGKEETTLNTAQETTHGHKVSTSETDSNSQTHGHVIRSDKDTQEKTTYGKKTTDTLGTSQKTTYGKQTTDARGVSSTTTYGAKIDNTNDLTEATEHGEHINTETTDDQNTLKARVETVKRTDTIATRDVDTSGTSNGTGASDSRSLAASLPRTDAYKASSFPSATPVTKTFAAGGNNLPVQGMDETGMDWRNADSQTETASANSTTGSTTGKTTTKVDGNDVSTTETSYNGAPDNVHDDKTEEVRHSGTDTKTNTGTTSEQHSGEDVVSETGQNTTTDAGSDTVANTGTNTTADSGNDILYHTGADTETHSGVDKTDGTKTGSETHSGVDKVANSGINSTAHTGTDTTEGTDTTIYDNYDRERYTGRDGSPADLLKAARSYISGTGAYTWLCRKVDTCFLDIYEF